MMKNLALLFCLSALTTTPAHAQELQGPEPAVALSLSLTVGFGSGHFYAGKPGWGAYYLLMEGVAAGVLGAQYSLAVNKPRKFQPEVTTAAGVALGLIKLTEILSSPILAAEARQTATVVQEEPKRKPKPPTLPLGEASAVVSTIYQALGRDWDIEYEPAVEVVAILLADGVLPSVIITNSVEYLRLHIRSSVASGILVACNGEDQ